MVNVYEKALGILDQYGWHQGSFGNRDDGYCVIGALAKAKHRSVNGHGVNVYDEAAALLRLLDSDVLERYQDRVGNLLVAFNDDPRTSEEDVRLLLKRAAVEL